MRGSRPVSRTRCRAQSPLFAAPVSACVQVVVKKKKGCVLQTVALKQCHDIKLVLQLRSTAADMLKLDANLLSSLNVNPCVCDGGDEPLLFSVTHRTLVCNDRPL